ncbi:YVTN repeat-like/Quino protein amine dehydrogenase, partial [Obba rivulosa]
MKCISTRDTWWNPHLRTISTKHHSIVDVRYHPDSRHFASYSRDGHVDLWDAVSGVQVRSEEACSNADSSAVFSPSGSIYASLKDDVRVLVWCGNQSEDPQELICSRIASTTISFTSDETHAAFGSRNDVCIWDPKTGQSLNVLTGHASDVVSTVFFSHSGKIYLASMHQDKCVIIWDAAEGTRIKDLSLSHLGSISQITVSRNGHILAVASDIVHLWNTHTWQPLPSLRAKDNSTVTSITFSPSSDLLVSSSENGSLQVWDLWGISSYVPMPYDHTTSVTCMAFSPNGHHLLSGAQDGQIIIWDASSGKRLKTLDGHKSSILDMSFSHDGKQLTSTAYNESPIVWDLGTGQII